MNTKHTPGPWTVEHGLSSDQAKYTPGIDANGETFTVILYGIKREGDACGIRGRTDDEQEANARLIAAAPELLAFAQAFLADYQSEDGMQLMKHYAKQAHAAIAKATGGEA